MSESGRLVDEISNISNEAREDLTRRVRDIEQGYRAVAEKMGQLYICADRNEVASLTRSLDKPMRNASENEQTFAAILDVLQIAENRGH